MKFDQLVEQHLVENHTMDLHDVMALAKHSNSVTDLNEELFTRVHLRQISQEVFLKYLELTQPPSIDHIVKTLVDAAHSGEFL